MQVTVITVEGVLTRSDDLRNAQPTKWAKTLYEGWRSQTNTVALTRSDPTLAAWWFRREHMLDWSDIHTYVQPEATHFTWERWRYEKIREFLADGWEIHAYVDTSLDIVEAVRDLGVMGIHIAYPTMAVGYREDQPVPRAWNDVVSTMETPA